MTTLKPTDFPAILPVFPVAGAMVLPNGTLPLWVFEPRYIALVDEVMGMGRHFGLLQPKTDVASLSDDDRREALVNPKPPELYNVGTLVRITHFAESNKEGGYLIRVRGLSRFKVVAEDQGRSGYRQMLVDYAPYASDLHPETTQADGRVDRIRFLKAVTNYLRLQGVETDTVELMKEGSDEDLVTTTTMFAPMMAHEKQAILETEGVVDRAKLIIAMFEMALLQENSPNILH